MSYDTWKATDRLGDAADGESRAEQRADDAERAARYEQFIALVREHAARNYGAWDCIIGMIGREYRLRDARSPIYDPFTVELHAYAASASWPMVLRAVADAMEAER